MQVVMNKCFLINPEKLRLVVFEKTTKSHTLIPKNNVTEPKARLYSNNQLKIYQLVKRQFLALWFLKL